MSSSQTKGQTSHEGRVAEACAALDMLNGQQKMKPPNEIERTNPGAADRPSEPKCSRLAHAAMGSMEAPFNEQLETLIAASTDLRSGSAKDVKTLVADTIMPQLKRLEASFIDAQRYYLVGVYVVGRAIRHGGSDSGRQSLLKAFGVDSGKKIYLAILNRVHELPTEARARKRMQGRFSDYQVALAEAARQNLDADTLLLRLMEDGGVAALVKTARALKPEKEPRRADRRGKARVEDRPRRGKAYAAGSKNAVETESEADGGKLGADGDDWGTPKPATLNSANQETSRTAKALSAGRGNESKHRRETERSKSDGNLVVRRKARDTFNSGNGGSYWALVDLEPGEVPTLRLNNLSPYAEHDYETDQKALEAMIRSIRRDRGKW